MKKAFPLILSLAVTPVAAQDTTTGYIGFKTGSLDIALTEFDPDTPRGFVAGFQKGPFGVEFERVSADIDITIGSYPYSIAIPVDFSTTALYGVYRSEGNAYFKAKAGILKEEIDDISDTGTSYGIGVGVKSSAIAVEAEYTIIETDVNFFSVGANILF